MSVDIKKLESLYVLASQITGASRWPRLDKVLKDNNKVLTKQWDIEKLKKYYGNAPGGYVSPEAKVRVLSDPAFSYLVAFHADKRFLRGDKYRKVFDDVTETPIEVDDLIEKHKIGLHVINQHKRYDPFPDRGKIFTKKKFGKRIIWREKE